MHPGARSSAHKVFFGTTEILIPIYNSIAEAVMANPTVTFLFIIYLRIQADVFINFASFRSVYKSSLVSLNTQSIRLLICMTIVLMPLRVIVIVTEGVPERDMRRLIVTANRNAKTIIGPGTVGAIQVLLVIEKKKLHCFRLAFSRLETLAAP